MCGIVGFTGKKNFSKLSSLLQLIEHRGRDGKALFYSKGIHLGMNRLAIIDLTPHLYPMKYKQYTLIFNGEIYNYKELKQQLAAKEISFQTTCDAEVILPLFHMYGFRAFSLLEGMFALGIYDKTKRRLILARDKSGEKPLYFMRRAVGIAFASELKVLLDFNHEPNTLAIRNLSQYLTQGFVFAPDTLVQNIQKVPPSNYLLYDLKTNTINVKPYWEPTHHLSSISSRTETDDLADQLETLLRNSVKLRLIADVPVGCFLSGGVDSSLVTLFASQEKHNMRTYSVSFPEHGEYDESTFASLVAQRLKTKHTTVLCTSQKVRALLDHIGLLIDEPIIDPAVLPTLLMAQEARKRVKVVLTGEGADELFGGYDRYRKQGAIETVRHALRRFPAIFQLFGKVPVRRIQSLSKSLVERYSAQRAWDDKDLRRLLSEHVYSLPQHKYLRQYGVANPLLSMRLTDYRGYMAEQLLMKIDKSTMARNLEARAPYLDTRIISFAFSMPNPQNIHFLQGKYVLKKIAERYFPKSLVWRKKHGFDIPLREWFQDELRDYVDQSAIDLRDYSAIFNVNYYTHIVAEHMEGRFDHSNKIWSMLVLVKWMKVHNISL